MHLSPVNLIESLELLKLESSFVVYTWNKGNYNIFCHFFLTMQYKFIAEIMKKINSIKTNTFLNDSSNKSYYK